MDQTLNRMPKIMTHLLFEQSATFANEFRKLGYEAQCYDIQNEYGKTDNICDLFQAIELAYESKPSILDRIGGGEIVMAFFPCTQFETQKTLWFRGENYGQKDWSEQQNLEYAMQLHETLHEYYKLISKLVLIAIKRGWHLVIENPYSEDHYLKRYFPIKAKLIDKDRTRDGDYFKKPTQYWFVGFEPQCNLVLEPLEQVRKKCIVSIGKGKERSEIHPQYARRFIKQYLIEQ